MEKTPEEIQTAFEGLPKPLQEAITNARVSSALSAIGTEFQLHISSMATLYDLTQMVCVGLLPAKDFVAEVQKTVPELSTQQLIELIQKINTQIFEPIRAYEQKIEEQRKEEEAFERLAKKYAEEDQAATNQQSQPQMTSVAATTAQPAITLSDIKSATASNTAQKMTIGEWKASGVVKSDTQKTTVKNYTDKPDPYRES